jgi:outer membrane receptor protein involved in Fe transport
VNLVASLGRGFRAANLVERFFNGPTPEGSGYQKSSLNLRPETSLNLDVGARYQNGTTSAEVFTFRNTLHDGIRTAPTGDSVNRMPAYQNVNVDQLRFTGTELSAQTLLLNALVVRASYTRLNSRDVLNPDNAIGHTYSAKTVGEIEYRPASPWWLSYTVRHNGRQVDGQLGDNPVGTELPAFTVHSARAGVRVFDRGRLNGTLTLALENIANTLYAESANIGFFRPAAGRSFLASWSLGF